MTTEISGKVQELHRKLSDCLNTVKLGVAGRFIYYDQENNMFILAIHATSPEKTQEVASLAWDNISEELKAGLQEANIGFAAKQI